MREDNGMVPHFARSYLDQADVVSVTPTSVKSPVRQMRIVISRDRCVTIATIDAMLVACVHHTPSLGNGQYSTLIASF